MQIIYSKQHKEIVGSVNDAPYKVSFDADGIAEVEDVVAEQLTSGDFGVVLLDEDGAEINKAAKAAKEAAEAKRLEDEAAAKEEADRLAKEAEEATEQERLMKEAEDQRIAKEAEQKRLADEAKKAEKAAKKADGSDPK